MAEAVSAKGAVGPRLTAAVTRSLREGALWVFGAVSLLLLLALASYDASDPGFSYTGEPGRVSNLVGPAGAWLADVFLLLFGGPSFLFPVMLGYAGFLLFRPPAGEAPSRTTLGFRLLGFALTLATSSGIATLHFAGTTYPNSAGGILGDLVGNGLSHAFSFLGATLLLLALWFAGVSLFLGVSWLTIMDWIGNRVLAGHAWLKAFVAERKDKSVGREAKEVRKEAIREEKKKAEFKPPPRIEVPKPVIEKSERVEKEKQVPLFDRPHSKELPALKLLDDPPPREQGYSAEALEAMSRLVELKLRDFGVEVEVVAVHPGPVVTRFELRPAPGVKVSQISGLSKDIARALSAVSVRIVEVIPGKSVIGLEIPNEKREVVTLGEIIKSKTYDDVASPLALALGKDIGGNPVVADLQKMPHLLIAGTTGSGKSVGINAMVLSLLYKAPADQVRLIMVDPKMLELSVYEGIPHLLAPVVTDMKQAANALRWCVAEMERRYMLMAALGVRNIGGYNKKIKDANDAGKPIPDPVLQQRLQQGDVSQLGMDGNVPNCEPLPYIVVVIDELADLMMIVDPPDPRDAASVRRRHHRPDQGEHPDAHRVPGVREGRLANDPRPAGRRIAARSRRHAVPAARHVGPEPRARCVRLGPGGPPRGQLAAECHAELHRGNSGGSARSDPGSAGGSRRGRRRRGWRTGCALRRGRADRARDPEGLRVRHPAPPQDRLQPRRAPGGDDGSGRAGRPSAAERLTRNPRPGTGRWLTSHARCASACPRRGARVPHERSARRGWRWPSSPLRRRRRPAPPPRRRPLRRARHRRPTCRHSRASSARSRRSSPSARISCRNSSTRARRPRSAPRAR
jgi:S-DNA-T family DNA segregation ATPase FtsK/SpoIIIE